MSSENVELNRTGPLPGWASETKRISELTQIVEAAAHRQIERHRWRVVSDGGDDYTEVSDLLTKRDRRINENGCMEAFSMVEDRLRRYGFDHNNFGPEELQIGKLRTGLAPVTAQAAEAFPGNATCLACGRSPREAVTFRQIDVMRCACGGRYFEAAEAIPPAFAELQDHWRVVSETIMTCGEADGHEFPLDWEHPVQEMDVVYARLAELCKRLQILPSCEVIDVYLGAVGHGQGRAEATRDSETPEEAESKELAKRDRSHLRLVVSGDQPDGLSTDVGGAETR